MNMFRIVMITVMGLMSLYVGRGTNRLLGLTHAARFAVWATLGVLFMCQIISRRIMGDPEFAGRVSRVVIWQWAGAIAMAILIVLFLVVVTIDIGRAAGHRIARRRAPSNPSRRDALTTMGRVAFVGISGAITGVGVVEATRTPRIMEVEIPIVGLPTALHGFRIAQITDLHVGPTIGRDFVEAVVAQTNSLNADLIAVTGDLIDGYVPSLSDAVQPLATLRARHGVFFVTGNHEYYWGAGPWCDKMRALGMTVLLNAHHVVEHDGARVLVAGVTDFMAGRYGTDRETDPHAACANAPETDFRLLLAHQPKSCYEAATAGYHLQISGHTHGGQILPWALFVRLVQPYVVGLARHEGMWVYVSRGTGYWGPPLRLGVVSEITSLRLVPAVV